jgi:hypothetical protein
VARRRRDVTAGAPSSGSRVILCPLHRATPADGAPRCCMYCLSFPDHRLSISGSIAAGTLGTGVSRSCCIVLVPLHCRDARRPTCRVAQVGRVEPLRSDAGGDALRRVPSEPGPCTTVSCVERSISEPARSAARHFRRLLLSIARFARWHSALRTADVRRPLRTRPHRADRRAPARGEPVVTGVPWACDVEIRERSHVVVSTSDRAWSCSERSEKEKSRRRRSPDMHCRRDWANAHANGVVHRLVNIGTRLPGRAE